MGDDPMALLGLEGALKHYYYLFMFNSLARPKALAIGVMIGKAI
jgi:hypothetical protein